MIFNKTTVALLCLSLGSASAFSTSSKSVAFVARSTSAVVARTCSAGCTCAACTSVHPAGCGCDACGSSRMSTALFADVAEEVPAEVEALDGVESSDEAHNVERPARSSIKKKREPKGKPLSEFTAGSMVKGSVRTLTTYGAFVDIGATTDGLLHISQLSSEYVGDVNEVLKAGQEVEVRIVSIDSDKGQVALSLLSQDEADASESAQKQRRDRPQRQNNKRRDDSALLSSISEKGWDSSAFVEGTVLNTVDFGCFVKVDASQLNSEVEGSVEGLLHISALRAGRVNSVTDVVNVNDKVQVRLKEINGNKISFTMLSVEDEESKAESNGPMGGFEGAKDWKESLAKFDDTMPAFKNGPMVVDLRK